VRKVRTNVLAIDAFVHDTLEMRYDLESIWW
jgi:hypothetical protein